MTFRVTSLSSCTTSPPELPHRFGPSAPAPIPSVSWSSPNIDSPRPDDVITSAAAARRALSAAIRSARDSFGRGRRCALQSPLASALCFKDLFDARWREALQSGDEHVTVRRCVLLHPLPAAAAHPARMIAAVAIGNRAKATVRASPLYPSLSSPRPGRAKIPSLLLPRYPHLQTAGEIQAAALVRACISRRARPSSRRTRS